MSRFLRPTPLRAILAGALALVGACSTEAPTPSAPLDADGLVAELRRTTPAPDPKWTGISRWTDRRTQLEGAEAALLAEVRANRATPDTQAALGRIYVEVGEFARGTWFLCEALTARPEDADSWVQLANGRAAVSEEEQAIVFYDRALELNRDLTAAWAKRAEARLALGDVAGARSDFEAALERSPRQLPARLGLANLAEEAGELEEARKHLERALSVDGTEPTALFRLARVLGDLGLDAEAEAVRLRHQRAAILEDLRERTTSGSPSKKRLIVGRHLLADGDLEDALRELRASLDLARDDAERVAALDALLACADAGAELADEGDLLRELAELDPEHARVAE